MKGNFIEVYIHLIWGTKRREDILLPKIRYELYDHIRKNAVKKGIFLDCINGVEDHVHVLVSFTATQSIAQIVQLIKGESSIWLNENFFNGFFRWSDGYGAFSVSPYPDNLQKARNYIFKQEEHHKKHTYQEELEWLSKMYKPEKPSQ